MLEGSSKKDNFFKNWIGFLNKSNKFYARRIFWSQLVRALYVDIIKRFKKKKNLDSYIRVKNA